MDVSPELPALARQWQEALRRDPEPASAWLSRVRSAGVRYGDDALCRSRQPMLVDDEIVETYAIVIARMRVAVRAARELMVEDGLDGRPDSVAVRIGVDPFAIGLAAVEPGYTSAAVLARFDSFLHRDADGLLQPRFLELNAESPAGMAYNDALSALILADPITDRLGLRLEAFGLARTAARAALATWRSWTRASGSPTVAIVDLPGVATRPEFLLFARAFESLGMRCVVADADQLDFDGERLRAGDVDIDLVYRRLLVADVQAQPAACAALVQAYRQGKVCVVNSFRNSLLHSKGLFALFHDPLLRRRLPEGVAPILDRCVPWTGLLSRGAGPESDELRERARREPEGWVLKPLSGHGGHGVVLGWQQDGQSWARAVDEAQDHVLQRRVPEWRLPFPDARADHALRTMGVSLDPFVIRGGLAGFLCRLTEGELANVTTGGASQVPVLRLA